MIKILMDARVLGYRPSGIGMYVYYLVKELKKYPDLTFSLITDVIESDEIKEFKQEGIKILIYGRLVAKSRQVFSYYKFVNECIRKEKPDIFWEGNQLSPRKLSNPYGKMFTTIYDMFPISNPEHFSKSYPFYFHHGIKRVIKDFDVIVYDSYDCKKNAEKYFPQIEGKKNFVGYVIVPPMPEMDTEDCGYFLYVGNLESRKGADILLRAYRIYCANGGKRELHLAGKVREQQIDQLMREVKESTNGLKYLGYVSEQLRNREYAQCHCFVFPSRAEGFGIPIIEAMHYNKPVIAGDLATLREVAGNCINYFSVEGDIDEVSARLADHMLKDNMSVDELSYKSIVARYSAANVGKQYYEMIKKYR